MLKRYIKPEALSIQTEELCTNFIHASVISGKDKNTLKDVIPVVEDRDMNNRPNDTSGAWGSDVWGGD